MGSIPVPSGADHRSPWSAKRRKPLCANHAFNNNTNAARYNKEAAARAWGRTIQFFRKYL